MLLAHNLCNCGTSYSSPLACRQASLWQFQQTSGVDKHGVQIADITLCTQYDKISECKMAISMDCNNMSAGIPVLYLLSDPRAAKVTLRFLPNLGHFHALYSHMSLALSSLFLTSSSRTPLPPPPCYNFTLSKPDCPDSLERAFLLGLPLLPHFVCYPQSTWAP